MSRARDKFCIVHGCHGRVYARGVCRECYEYLLTGNFLPPSGTSGREDVADAWPDSSAHLPFADERREEIESTLAWTERQNKKKEKDVSGYPDIYGAAGHYVLPKVRVTPVKTFPCEGDTCDCSATETPEREECSFDDIEDAWREVVKELNDMDAPTVLTCVYMRAIQCMDEAGLTELAALSLALLPETNNDERGGS